MRIISCIPYTGTPCVSHSDLSAYSSASSSVAGFQAQSGRGSVGVGVRPDCDRILAGLRLDYNRITIKIWPNGGRNCRHNCGYCLARISICLTRIPIELLSKFDARSGRTPNSVGPQPD